MSSVLLLSPPRELALDTVEPRRARLRDHVTARVRAHSLDRRLAAGVPPERSAALSLRARRLIDPSTAQTLSRALCALVRDARAWAVPRGRMPARLQAVRELGDEIEDLARRLVAPPLAVQGVALVRLLVTDGRGPLYSFRASEDLASAVRRARAALEVL